MKTRIFRSLAGFSLFMLGAGALVLLHAQSFQFTGVQRLTNSEVVLTLNAPVGRAYRIESSTNLAEWSGLVTFATNGDTGLHYLDSAAPYLPTRYYRATRLAGTNNLSGDHLSTTNGDVVIHPLYHASFLMSWNGKIIYNDPDDDLDYEAHYTGMPKADLILVSHGHGDHFSTAKIDAVRGPNCRIIAPLAVYNSLTIPQRAIAIVLANGASTNVHDLTVSAVPAYNGNHPQGQGNGYVLTIGGKRIYASGDTGDQVEIRALPNIDVAFLCMNLPFTMNSSSATNVIRAMRPKIAYPYHYREMSGATAVYTNAAYFKQLLGTDLGIEVRLRNWY